MWLAIVMGIPQIVRPVWNAQRAARAQRLGRNVRASRMTPFLADIVKAVRAGRARRGAAGSSLATGAAVPRGLPEERAARVLGTAVCGAWGTTESCLGSLAAPGDEPQSLGPMDARCADPSADYRFGRTHRAGGRGRALRSAVADDVFDGCRRSAGWTAWRPIRPTARFRTGDLGVMDESGYVRITGRVRGVINRGEEGLRR